MKPWTDDELNKIGRAEELRIATLRRKPVTIWVVRLDDDLYVRCVNGRQGAWFRGTQTRHQGPIRAGGVVKDVSFVDESDPAVNDQIDDPYRSKYHRYSANIVNSVLSPEAHSATIKLVPR
jgi:hypothetical protein